MSYRDVLKRMPSTALKNPWALVQFGGAPAGSKRPGTSVAFLTEEAEDYFVGYLLTLEPNRTIGGHEWCSRYDHARRIPKAKVLHVFPRQPGAWEIHEARRAVPKIS
jgi:hypothetical protein